MLLWRNPIDLWVGEISHVPVSNRTCDWKFHGKVAPPSELLSAHNWASCPASTERETATAILVQGGDIRICRSVPRIVRTLPQQSHNRRCEMRQMTGRRPDSLSGGY